MIKYSSKLIKNLNNDLKSGFTHLFPITDDMKKSFSGVSRLVMLDRYTQKDLSLESLSVGDLVITIVKNDPKFPARGIGNILEINGDYVKIKLEEEYLATAEDADKDGCIIRSKRIIDKPLELYFEQIAKRLAHHLGEDEDEQTIKDFYDEVSSLNLVPASSSWKSPIWCWKQYRCNLF